MSLRGSDKSVQFSLQISLKDLSYDRLQEFILLGVFPENIGISPEMASTLWNINTNLAKDYLIEYQEKGLMEPGLPSNGKPTFRLHDILNDLANQLMISPIDPDKEDSISGLGFKTSQKAHRILLQRYKAKIKNADWSALPDDGYIHSHLTWHMRKAGLMSEIHKILREETGDGKNAWFEVCESLGQTDIFIKDVNLAWNLAKKRSILAIRRDKMATSMGLEARYALIIASICTIANNIPPSLLANLLEARIISPMQGLNYARLMPDPKKMSKALIELTPYLPGPLRSQALEKSKEINKNQFCGWYLKHSMEELFPHLIRSIDFQKELMDARNYPDAYYRASSMSEIAANLSSPQKEKVLREALALTRKLHDEDVLDLALKDFSIFLDSMYNPNKQDKKRLGRRDCQQSLISRGRLERSPLEIYMYWNKELETLSWGTRDHLLNELRNLIPCVLYLGGKKALKDIVLAINNVRQWWL
jgi:hypothetical protein